MEFGEKLQELRKSKVLTQEELAEELYVSRTAISKWESGRGYPSIDSLKEISAFFSVTIDELLSGEKILSLAEKENKSNIRKMCNLIFGIADVLSFLLIVLPLYPNPVGGHIYSVNLFDYAEISPVQKLIYWVVFLAFVVAGGVKIAFTRLGMEKGQKLVTACSMGLGILAVLILGMSREPYAVVVAFMLLMGKGVLLSMIKESSFPKEEKGYN